LAGPRALGQRNDFIGGGKWSATTTRRRVMRHAGWLSIAGVVIALALVVAAVPFVMPSENVPAHKLAAAVIFTASYLALAVGKIPASRSIAPVSR
jgi:hypothetical protein